jgi:uncharacterized protein (TIGR02118 family)
MIKLIFCVRRLPHLTREAFDAYWRDRHGPLVRSHAAALRIKRYVQTSTLDDPAMQERARASRDLLPAEFDGVAELWWESRAVLAAVRKTPEGAAALAALLEDERRFIDLKHSQMWYGAEREIFPG